MILKTEGPRVQVRDITKALDELPLADVERVRKKCALLLSANGGNASAKEAAALPMGSMFANVLLQSIIFQFGKRGVALTPGMVRGMKAWTKVETQHAPDLDLHLRFGMRKRSGVVTKTEMGRLTNIAVNVLMKNLDAMGIAVSIGTVLRHMGRASAAMGLAFPQYAHHGMYPLLLSLETAVQVRDSFTKLVRAPDA